jgi:hypothetical protein
VACAGVVAGVAVVVAGFFDMVGSFGDFLLAKFRARYDVAGSSGAALIETGGL